MRTNHACHSKLLLTLSTTVLSGFFISQTRVVDPYLFFADPDPAVFLNADPDPEPDLQNL